MQVVSKADRYHPKLDASRARQGARIRANNVAVVLSAFSLLTETLNNGLSNPGVRI